MKAKLTTGSPSVNPKPRNGFSFAPDQTWIPVKRKCRHSLYVLIATYTRTVTFVDESCEPSQGEEGSPPDGSEPSGAIQAKRRSPSKKLPEGEHIEVSTNSILLPVSLGTPVSPNCKDGRIEVFSRADSRPITAGSEHINSPISFYHVNKEPPGDSRSQTNGQDEICHVHASHFSPTTVLEYGPSAVAFSPAAFTTAPIHQSSHITDHEDAGQREISIQSSPAASTFTAPAISMTKEEAVLFRHYLENLAPWVCQVFLIFRLISRFSSFYETYLLGCACSLILATHSSIFDWTYRYELHPQPHSCTQFLLLHQDTSPLFPTMTTLSARHIMKSVSPP